MLLACTLGRPESEHEVRPKTVTAIDFKGFFRVRDEREAELHSIYLENMFLHVFVFKFKKKKKTVNK